MKVHVVDCAGTCVQTMGWEVHVVDCAGTCSRHVLQALRTKLGGPRWTPWMRTRRLRIEAESLKTSVRRFVQIGHVQAILEALASVHEHPWFVVAVVLHCDARLSLPTYCFFFCQD